MRLVFLVSIYFTLVRGLYADVKPAHEVKSLFLINVLRYTEWPEKSTKELRVAFVGESEVFQSFKKLEKQKVGQRNLKIDKFRRYNSTLKLEGYHCVFISSDHKVAFDTIVQSLDSKAILTVGENPWFLESGGMMNFLIVKGRVRFQINFKNLEKNPLKLSSKVLRFSYKGDK